MKKSDFLEASFPQRRTVKLGDKVRFLNSVGGGIVTAFHGKDQVLVQDENGFDIPVLIAECVVVGEVDTQLDNREPTPYKPQAKKPASGQAKEIPQKQETSLPFMETPQGERLNISFAFLPVEHKSFINTPFEAYIINDSNYYLYINYMSCSNNAWTSRFHGTIEPDTVLFVEEFSKSLLGELEHICVQIIAFKDGKSYSFKNPLSIEMRLDTVKFYKMHCFIPNKYFDEDALIVPLVVNDRPVRQMLVSAEDITEAIISSKSGDRHRSPQPAKKNKSMGKEIIEVDLHINQLLDSTAGLSNTDMLNYQLSKFHETMKAYLKNKGQQIVFIHGKGEGVLRAAIEKELNNTYKQQCRFQDASFREYGFGATMVIIR